MSKDIINKHKVYVVDNIDKANAQYLSIKYPKIIFFTDTGEIYKNGEIYTSIIGVDPNYNKIDIGNKTYKISIENKLLKISSVNAWYWYVGTSKQYSISSVESENSKSTGWRFITDKSSIIDSKVEGLTINVWPNVEDMSDYDNQDNAIYLSETDIHNDNLYIYLPTDLINNYKVGIYDVFNRTNFLIEGGVLSKLNETVKIDNINYNIYKFIKKPINTFNLKIYSKQ